MASSPDSSAWRLLQTRLLELEHERSAARERADVLERLYHVFADIALTRSPNEIVERTLRAAHSPLGFSRAMFLRLESPATIRVEQIVDRGELVDPHGEALHAPPGTPLAGIAFGRGPACDVGRAADLCAPFVDCRDWYIVARLERAGRLAGLIYADGYPHPAPCEPAVSLIPILAAIAAVAIDNSVLFAKSQELAERDPLTGLFNRRAFDARAAAEIERSRRERKAIAYVLVDLDDFKAINDRGGHAFGDAVLSRVARTLTRCSRPQDLVGRFAGDEFVMLFSAIDERLANALVSRLSSELRAEGLSCSIGAALYPRDGESPADLFAAADRALYATKALGKNGYTFSPPTRSRRSP